MASSTRTDARRACISHDAEGTLLGVAVFLGANDLAALNIDGDSAAVSYWVEEGRVQCEPIDSSGCP